MLFYLVVEFIAVCLFCAFVALCVLAAIFGLHAFGVFALDVIATFVQCLWH